MSDITTQNDVEDKFQITLDTPEEVVVEPARPLKLPDKTFLHGGELYSTDEAELLFVEEKSSGKGVTYKANYEGDKGCFRVKYRREEKHKPSDRAEIVFYLGLFTQVFGFMTLLLVPVPGLLMILASFLCYPTYFYNRNTHVTIKGEFDKKISGYKDDFIHCYEKALDNSAFQTDSEGELKAVQPTQCSRNMDDYGFYIFAPGFARRYNEKYLPELKQSKHNNCSA